MPNKTIYIADEDMPIFQKAQEVAGESISKVIAQALRQYIIQMDLEGTEFKECEAWRGSHGIGLNVEKVRFIGKSVSKVTIVDEDECTNIYELYYTRKANFLLQTTFIVPVYVDAPVQYDYEKIEGFTKLYASNLPPKLIKDAEEQLGKAHIRFIDI